MQDMHPEFQIVPEGTINDPFFAGSQRCFKSCNPHADLIISVVHYSQVLRPSYFAAACIGHIEIDGHGHYLTLRWLGADPSSREI